ncbi:hypothetical protein RHAL1_01389 [Beijerinckiaceae bacterium RH AL1]|nr:tetratricopeptide repeat protein [Beijerinckiaceae bacterium]VVB44700.1 hypothetical protein RHCH11_RHCH11_01356 [Beijerinckiaceae bacterium RH CH11]VVB44778.1 hypothetical protein RHAL8_01353 [Beijerinckiaceae bacterium RH AL8]VVC54491.1 hypothetical protein RHAL1_01389 [Beijerinckiaceae bacterium RH AL1]
MSFLSGQVRRAVFPALEITASLSPRWRATLLGTLALRLAAMWLVEQFRYDEAEALLADELARRPRERRLLVPYAYVAHGRGDYEEAIARWTRARQAGASEPLCVACLATNHRALQRFEIAQALIDEALARFPNDLTVLTEAARLARDRHRPADAAAFWHRAIRRARPHPDWLQGYAQSLFFQGDFDRADKILTAARRRFPSHFGLRAAQGAIIVARQRWPEAVAFWTDYRRRYPDDPSGWEQLGIAVQGASLSHAADVQPAPPVLADIGVIEDEPMRKLVLRFESIGDSCEMGLVQRRYGAEPLGLLRWNDVSLDNLVAALEHRLKGMGEPENTAILTAVNGEFYVTDRRWALTMHTFLFAGHVDADDVYRKMCRRIVYLRGKLLEDLAEASKVFVFRSPTLDVAGLRRLHAALRAFGPVTVLGVVPLDTAVAAWTGRQAGSVERIDDDLYVGFLGRSGTDALGAWNIAFEDWTQVFARTLEAKEAHLTPARSPS